MTRKTSIENRHRLRYMQHMGQRRAALVLEIENNARRAMDLIRQLQFIDDILDGKNPMFTLEATMPKSDDTPAAPIRKRATRRKGKA